MLNNRLAYNLPRLVPNQVARGINPKTLTASPAAIRQLPAPVQHGVLEALARSIHVVFLFGVPLLVVAFFITFLLREVPLRETAHLTVGPELEAEPVGAAAVLVAEAVDA